jgi:hypothetical protein
MAHQPYDAGQEPRRLIDIVAADEVQPTIGRQIMNGIGGMLVLMLTGLIILLLVLWKSP